MDNNNHHHLHRSHTFCIEVSYCSNKTMFFHDRRFHFLKEKNIYCFTTWLPWNPRMQASPTLGFMCMCGSLCATRFLKFRFTDSGGKSLARSLWNFSLHSIGGHNAYNHCHCDVNVPTILTLCFIGFPIDFWTEIWITNKQNKLCHHSPTYWLYVTCIHFFDQYIDILPHAYIHIWQSALLFHLQGRWSCKWFYVKGCVRCTVYPW